MGSDGILFQVGGVHHELGESGVFEHEFLVHEFLPLHLQDPLGFHEIDSVIGIDLLQVLTHSDVSIPVHLSLMVPHQHQNITQSVFRLKLEGEFGDWNTWHEWTSILTLHYFEFGVHFKRFGPLVNPLHLWFRSLGDQFLNHDLFNLGF